MPNYTANLNLKKPLSTENYNVDDANGNADLIDAALAAKETPAGAQAKVNTAIAALLNGAPGALDTLKELADAMADDANFAATMTNALALKAPLLSPALTGTPTVPTAVAGTNTTQAASTAFVEAARVILANADAAHLADDVHHVNYAPDTGAANAYVVTLSPAQTTYTAGMVISFKALNANTGASTININNIGVKSITKNVSTALASGDILSGQIIDVEYDGLNFQMAPANSIPGGSSDGQSLMNQGGNVGWGMVESIINSYVVNTGETINVGDLVAYISGNIKKIQPSTTPNALSSLSIADSVMNTVNGTKACRISDSLFAVLYWNSGNNVLVRIGKVVGGQITYNAVSLSLDGTVYNQFGAFDIVALSDTSFVVSYTYSSNNYGQCMYCVVNSDLSVTKYAVSQFIASSLVSGRLRLVPLTSSTFAIFYSLDNSAIKYKIGTVSGGAIAFGSEVVLTPTGIIRDILPLSSTSIILAYGTRCAVVNGIGGTASNGTAVQFDASAGNNANLCLLSPTTFIVTYINASSTLYAVVGTISGTTITYGTAVSVCPAQATNVAFANTTAISSSIAMVSFVSSGYLYGYYVPITISGTTITAGSNTQIGSQAFSAYELFSTNHGNQVVFTAPEQGSVYCCSLFFPTDYTAFVGISKDTKTAGQTCRVVLSGILRGLSGLTPGQSYYGSGLGSLTTAADSKILVGKALSSTDILVAPNLPGSSVQTNKGTFSDTSTSIGAGSSYTKTIPLGMNAQKGRIILQGGKGNFQSGAEIFFSTTPSDTTAISSDLTSAIFEFYSPSYPRSTSPTLITRSCFDNSGYISIESCYISGTNLLIKFDNTSGAGSTLQVKQAYWEVEG